MVFSVTKQRAAWESVVHGLSASGGAEGGSGPVARGCVRPVPIVAAPVPTPPRRTRRKGMQRFMSRQLPPEMVEKSVVKTHGNPCCNQGQVPRARAKG